MSITSEDRNRLRGSVKTKLGSTRGLWYLENSEIYVAKYKPCGGIRGRTNGKVVRVLVFTIQHETIFPWVIF